MDHLKEGIGLRGYAQQDPLVAYKKESFEMFEAMMMRFQEDTARHLFRMQIIGPDGQAIDPETVTIFTNQAPPELQSPGQAGQLGLSANGSTPALASPELARQPVPVPTRAPSTTIDALEKEFQRKKQRELDAARSAGATASSNGAGAPRRSGEKVGRNDDCPCGSGKKYKKCHGIGL
jgi:preprotein translocase subunit SecA